MHAECDAYESLEDYIYYAYDEWELEYAEPGVGFLTEALIDNGYVNK